MTVTLPQTIVIMGPAGSGKTTLCQKLCQKYPEYQSYSCGKIYRDSKEQQTPEYLQLVQSKSISGVAYKDQLNKFIIQHFSTHLSPDQPAIIEGLNDNDLYPFVTQIRPIDLIILLNGDPDILIERIVNRYQGRNEDNRHDAPRRIANYYRFEHRLFRLIHKLHLRSLFFDTTYDDLNDILTRLQPILISS